MQHIVPKGQEQSSEHRTEVLFVDDDGAVWVVFSSVKWAAVLMHRSISFLRNGVHFVALYVPLFFLSLWLSFLCFHVNIFMLYAGKRLLWLNQGQIKDTCFLSTCKLYGQYRGYEQCEVRVGWECVFLVILCVCVCACVCLRVRIKGHVWVQVRVYK